MTVSNVYEAPAMTVIEFGASDVVRTSNSYPNYMPNPGDNVGNQSAEDLFGQY
ncbi:hypothetical protein BTIS_0133 [Bifidobacterium tissieri]|uniref:Uncharacterized protein n=1 Tax=Bifidobacterium tissieri TaxID=1630162 RepID=A0A261FJS1_9BIFI|nr:hypothetical protein BTIS_0133 [Bifidobacterium tissieri]